MSKMGFHDPFAYSKHKLWPKENPTVKLPIWLPTIKSRESPWFVCVKVAWHILLKLSWRGLQLCFKPHFNQKFAQEVMGLQSCGSPNFKNFGTPNLGVSGQNDICVLTLWPSTNNTIRGKVMASPKSRTWWILWIHVYMWLVCAPKLFQLCTNQLVIWFA
jgi:hypothetical protein